MAELIAARSPLQVTFVNSLPLNVLLTMALVPTADQFEGLDEWLRNAAAALPVERRRELDLLTGFPGGYMRFVEAIAARLLPLHGEAEQGVFADLLSRLEALSVEDFQALALQSLRRGPLRDGTMAEELLRDPGHLAAALAINSHLDGASAAALVLDPADLRSRFLEALAHFWGGVYQPVYQECLPLLERSVEYHRRQAYPSQFDELFQAVTGRVIPVELQARLAEIQFIRFVPSCHLGPYVVFFQGGDLLTIFYNCRGTLLEERQAGEQVRSLFPVLKALTDETRLQILLLLLDREMYAQELVERLGLSQPAISRHLKLMLTAGLLRMRPEGGSKYYQADRDVLHRLAQELEHLSRST